MIRDHKNILKSQSASSAVNLLTFFARCSCSMNQKGSKYCNNCSFRMKQDKPAAAAAAAAAEDANQPYSDTFHPPSYIEIDEFTTCDLPSCGSFHFTVRMVFYNFGSFAISTYAAVAPVVLSFHITKLKIT